MPCSASAPQSCLVAATESPAAKKLPAYCCPCPHLSRSDQATLAVRLDERRRRASQERASQEHMMPKLMQSLTGRSRCPRRIQGTQEPAGIRIHTLCMPALLTREPSASTQLQCSGPGCAVCSELLSQISSGNAKNGANNGECMHTSWKRVQRNVSAYLLVHAASSERAQKGEHFSVVRVVSKPWFAISGMV